MSPRSHWLTTVMVIAMGCSTAEVKETCSPPPGETCSTAPLCGCPQDQNCYLVNDKLTCGSAGDRQINQRCTQQKDCAPGLACAGTSPDTQACLAYCEKDESCVPRGAAGACMRSRASASASVCWANCDPTDTNACGREGACSVATDPEGRLHSLCGGAGSGKQGDRCEPGACAAGFYCLLLADKTSRCSQWCSDKNPSCPVGTTCRATAPPIRIGDVEYRFCMN